MIPFDSILGMAWPVDVAGWMSLALGILALVALPRMLRGENARRRAWILGCSLVAAALSSIYIGYYLRGGPRIIDATSYWLEAKGFASGIVTWSTGHPSASERGRFLVQTLGEPGAVTLGVVFPPGYPALLAVGFAVGAPLLVGPMLAVCMTLLTAALARQVTGRTDVACVAAVLSTLNACLRYHTADTMSHGLAAVLLVSSVVLGWKAAAAKHRAAWWWLAAGCSAGWLCATRPVSGGALAVVGLPMVLLWGVRRRTLTPLALLAGVLPFALALVAHQRAVTGHECVAAQTAYYRVADGPPGCFRYGFGEGIGCVVEHGEYVASMLPHGFGWSAALRTTGRRLYLHLGDIVNYAPFAIPIVAGVAMVLTRRLRGAAVLVVMPCALVMAYAPFYFDGSFPGGGARLYAEALPFEHVLIAAVLVRWSERFSDAAFGRAWAIALAVAAPLVGFALHANHMHLALRDREGGRPFYEPSRVRSAMGEPSHGLLFVDTDHAFNLAHDPAAVSPAQSLLVRRRRNDDRDWLVWDRFGRPESWRYDDRGVVSAEVEPRVVRWQPPTPATWFRFEAEAEWPPLDQSGGYAAPTHLTDGCVSGGMALALQRTGESEACVTTEIPWPSKGRWQVRVWLVVQHDVSATASVRTATRNVAMDIPAAGALEAWPGRRSSPAEGRSCVPLEVKTIDSADEPSARLVFCTGDAWIGLDRVELRRGDDVDGGTRN